jgi:hypothetical protein
MGCIENITKVVNLIKKGEHRNSLEKYYMYNQIHKIIIKLMTKTRVLIIFYRADNIGRRQLKILIWSPCLGSNVIPCYPVSCRTYCFSAPHVRFGEVILNYNIWIYVYLQYPATLPLFTKIFFVYRAVLSSNIQKNKRHIKSQKSVN